MSEMRGVALEGMSLATQFDICEWMRVTFGPQSKTTWFIDVDYDLRSLIFNEEIATMIYLRWGHIL